MRTSDARVVSAQRKVALFVRIDPLTDLLPLRPAVDVVQLGGHGVGVDHGVDPERVLQSAHHLQYTVHRGVNSRE